MAVVWFLGDSVTEVNYMPESARWPTLVGGSIDADIVNYGDSGKITADFLDGGSNRAWFTALPRPDFVCLSFGYNDEDVITSAQFLLDSRALILDIESIGARAVMISQPTVDYPDHAVTNPNPTILDFNAQYTTINAEDGTDYIDFGDHITVKIAGGDWDWRIRRYVLLTPPDNVATNPDVWDDTLDAIMIPIHGEPLWDENIHGNTREQLERSSVVGDALGVLLADIVWTDVTNHATELVTAVVPVAAQTSILAHVNDAATMDANHFGGSTAAEYKLARIFFAAHLATYTPMGASGAAGPVSGEKVGRLSRSYAAASTSSALAATTYGIAFDDMLSMSGARAWVAL